MQIVADQAERHLAAASAGRYVMNQRRVYRQRDARIANAIRNLTTGRTTTIEFLEICANFFDPVARQVDDYVEIEEVSQLFSIQNFFSPFLNF